MPSWTLVSGYVRFGDVLVVGETRYPEQVPIFLNDALVSQENEPPRVKPPVAFNLVFRDNHGASDPVSIWQPIAPVSSSHSQHLIDGCRMGMLLSAILYMQIWKCLLWPLFTVWEKIWPFQAISNLTLFGNAVVLKWNSEVLSRRTTVVSSWRGCRVNCGYCQMVYWDLLSRRQTANILTRHSLESLTCQKSKLRTYDKPQTSTESPAWETGLAVADDKF